MKKKNALQYFNNICESYNCKGHSNFILLILKVVKCTDNGFNPFCIITEDILE